MNPEHRIMNPEDTRPMRDFTDLVVWQKGHELVLSVYAVTKTFPREEQFGLTSQMRRAAVSITSNVAEGFGRRSMKDKLRFYGIAQGSLTEIENQALIARDLHYVDTGHSLFEQIHITKKLLIGLMRKTSELQDSGFSFLYSSQDNAV